MDLRRWGRKDESACECVRSLFLCCTLGPHCLVGPLRNAALGGYLIAGQQPLTGVWWRGSGVNGLCPSYAAKNLAGFSPIYLLLSYFYLTFVPSLMGLRGASHPYPTFDFPYLSLLEPDGGSRTEKAGTASVTSLPKPESISPLWFRAVGERPGISPGAGDLWNLCI